jgi:hypothetical protein
MVKTESVAVRRSRPWPTYPTPADKLQAVLNYAAPDPDDELGAEYRDASAAWFARLTHGEHWRIAMVLAAYERGAEADAKRLASALPPAPKCPF